MSTETTNKKIKIDNGTTFGRTYTDKAVDELLKNVGGGGSISVIELTDKNGTIASAQLDKINANPQNFSFKYNGKILLFTSADSTTYQYCNNTTSSSDNNVMTASTLLTITSSTGVYTIAENVHNVVANSIHPANGGDLTNIQVGSKVYSIPSGGGGGTNVQELLFKVNVSTGDMNVGDVKSFRSNNIMIDTTNTTTLCYVPFYFSTVDTPYDINTATTLTITEYIDEDNGKANMKISIICLKAGKYTANLIFAAKRLYTNK